MALLYCLDNFGILNVSQPYRPPRPVTGIALLCCLDNVGSLTFHNPIGLHGLLQDDFTLLSRQCGIRNFSQPYRPPRPVTGIALLYCLDNVGSLTFHNPIGPHGLLRDGFTLLYFTIPTY
jgi:hypothetical protein